MHILFLTDNFPPEVNAPATRTYEHASRWVERGHKVTVITCVPNFPDGQVFDGYRNKLYQRENINGICVIRVKTYITNNNGFFKRTLDFLSFMFMGFLAGLFVKKPDVVVATSPQFFCAVGGWLLSVFKRRPFVFEVRDIWPASITAVGAMKATLAIRILEKIELFLYRKAKRIVVVTNAFRDDLVSRGVASSKIRVVLNGVDTNKYYPAEMKNEDFVRKLSLRNKFVIGYIGTHGLAHGLEHVVTAAELLKFRDNVVFLMVGAGSERAKIIDLVKSKQLPNVIFVPNQPKDKMPQLWSVCDVALVSLRNIPLFETVIPSKIFEAFSMGLPILFTAPEGEASSIVRGYDAGVVTPPESPKDLAKTAELLADDAGLYIRLGKNALKAAKKFDRNDLAVKMEGVLLDAIR
jgi:glycosyltransferase involved in cell wall biosynthesis